MSRAGGAAADPRRCDRPSPLRRRETIGDMEWFIAAVILAALGVAAAAAAGGLGEMRREPVRDYYRQDLPAGRSLTAEEVQAVRFGVTVRGYSMAQVDDLLERLVAEIGQRDALISQLRQQLPYPADRGPGEP